MHRHPATWDNLTLSASPSSPVDPETRSVPLPGCQVSEESFLALQPLFEISLDMLCIAGTDGFFKKVNPAFQAILGYTSEELLRRPFLDLVFPADIESTLHEMKTLEEGLPTVMFENRYFHRDGSIRWIQWNAVSLKEKHLIYAVARDVTKHKQDEEALKRYAEELAERNQQLRQIQEQLIQAEKMESVGRLAAGVAHEVKNPLAILQSGLDFLSLEGMTKDADSQEVLGQMSKAIARADKIVQGLLNFAKENELHLAPAELGELVEEVLLMVRHDLAKHKVKAVSEIPGDLPPVSVDRVKFEQVLINLITNSIHALKDVADANIQIRAFRKRLDSASKNPGSRSKDQFRTGDDVIVIEILDNGCGISPENLKKVFDPFFTTKPAGVGTGLGLTVVQKIVELHKGQIEILSRPEGGTLVRITLK